MTLGSLALGASANLGAHSHGLCQGFLPENDLYFPMSMALTDGGVTEAQFNRVLDKIDAVYSPIFKAKGQTFKIDRGWADGTVNARADYEDTTTPAIYMYGGLARHASMTEDGFLMVACHEVGHHLGGAPKTNWWGYEWASNEGEADYYATLKCMHMVLGNEDNAAAIQGKTIDPIVGAACDAHYTAAADRALCKRVSIASQALGNLLGELGGTGSPSYGTPDMNVVSETSDSHPEAQCRLDTYYQGSICTVPVADTLSDTDPNVGTCIASKGFKTGLRPRCWYKPSDLTHEGAPMVVGNL